ncbi:MAG: glycosyltransferase family 2 protein [Prosthecobacter sp.]
MRLDLITPLILTWNEEANLCRCLERVRWAAQVVVVDSGSTDGTAALAAEFPNVHLLVRPFDDHTTQWNFGVDAAGTRWVLSLDCDYVLGTGFEEELAGLPENDDGVDAYFASFRYLIFGKALRSCLYPPRAVLFRKDRCRYVPDGHTQMLQINGGRTSHLSTRIDHDDRKPLSRWFSSQDKYAKLEAEKLLALPPSELSAQDRIRRTMILGPVLVFFYTLLARQAVLDGWAGWFYTFQRTLAEIMLSLRLLERKLLPSVPPVNSSDLSQPNP